MAATITNGTDRPLQMIEVDYPGGSFGVSTLAPHAVYSYRFKAIGSGSLSISYADAAGSTRNATGPRMAESQGGSLTITIGDKGDVRWSPQLNKP